MRLRYSSLLLTIFAAVAITPAMGSADVYVYKDSRGVLNFTNVPNHDGYQPLYRDPVSPQEGALSSPADYDELIQSASNRHMIDSDLVRAVIKVESDFRPDARSKKGAMGLMQLMPDTVRLHNVMNAYDPGDNIDGGVRHLKLLLERYQGNLELGLAAYNAGIKAVEKYRGVPPFAETREYVRRVLRHYEAYRSNGLPALRKYY